jgi:hypothetical protein
VLDRGVAHGFSLYSLAQLRGLRLIYYQGRILTPSGHRLRGPDHRAPQGARSIAAHVNERLRCAGVPIRRAPRRGNMSVPSWMWGSDPAEFFTLARLRGRPVPGSAELWRVPTEECYRRVKPGLFNVDHLLGPAAPRPRLELLAIAGEQSLVADVGGAARGQVAERVRRTADSPSFVAAMGTWLLQTMDAPLGELPDVVAAIQTGLTELPVEGRPDQRCSPGPVLI